MLLVGFIARLTLGEKMRCVRNIMHEYVIVDVWYINVLSQRVSGIIRGGA